MEQARRPCRRAGRRYCGLLELELLGETRGRERRRRQVVHMVVRVFLVDVAVQERLRGLSRVRVVQRLSAVVLELVGGKADPDRRPESPGREAGDCSPSAARSKHRVIVEEAPGQVKENESEGSVPGAEPAPDWLAGGVWLQRRYSLFPSHSGI